MAGWRVGFALGNAPALAALARLKSYLDYGTFQPIQIASIVALNEARDYPAEACEIYRSRRDVLCDGLERIGWHVERPLGTMFVWAPIPEPYRELGSLEFAVKLTREAHVSVSPGVGFGPGGEGFVRFALVENEQRIAQAVRGIRRALPALAAAPTRSLARVSLRWPQRLWFGCLVVQPLPLEGPHAQIRHTSHPALRSRHRRLVVPIGAAPASEADVLDLETLTGLQAQKMMEDGKLTSVELTRAYIAPDRGAEQARPRPERGHAAQRGRAARTPRCWTRSAPTGTSAGPRTACRSCSRT